MMAAAWWWLGSGAAWFVALNAVVAAIAFLSSRAGPSLASPRLTRRASSALLQRLRSFSVFSSFPSATFHAAPLLHPADDAAAAAAAAAQETEEPLPSPAKSPPSRTAPAAAPPAAAERAPEAEEEEGGDENAMSMEDAYALAVAARGRPEPEREEEARRSEVDAMAEEFIRGFKEDLRQQRLNSIFNYTQMLRRRARAAGHRPPEPDQP
ncbi:hypothetical protein ACP4OV_025540 [Aristida adscensionis]